MGRKTLPEAVETLHEAEELAESLSERGSVKGAWTVVNRGVQAQMVASNVNVKRLAPEGWEVTDINMNSKVVTLRKEPRGEVVEALRTLGNEAVKVTADPHEINRKLGSAIAGEAELSVARRLHEWACMGGENEAADEALAVVTEYAYNQ